MAKQFKATERKAVQTAICERLIEGDSLRTICAADNMPAMSTVFRWLAEDSDEALAFSEQYARAREAQADAIFDEIIEIADDGRNDYVEKLRQDGEKDTAFDAEHVQRSRLRVDARKWVSSKLAPKKYGDDIRLRHANADGGRLRRDYTDEEMFVRLASLSAAAQKFSAGES
ncbi:hypothetical protein GGR90_002758 [Sphingopyxis italica]|uniref:Terminase small subunit protein n=1 Tax=Sphingopyxis italica TaxID=1129133 RepID=A0A7X5XSM9_9SPHN|nr:hypothetical protein [Sphingopyxis italica]NJB90564.1 hypothetical protein [Sphingopyxis italica]